MTEKILFATESIPTIGAMVPHVVKNTTGCSTCVKILFVTEAVTLFVKADIVMIYFSTPTHNCENIEIIVCIIYSSYYPVCFGVLALLRPVIEFNVVARPIAQYEVFHLLHM